MVLHEVRGTAADVPDDGTHIIPAFGAGMCPKLVAQVSSAKRSVRVSALLALCDEDADFLDAEQAVPASQHLTHVHYAKRVHLLTRMFSKFIL